MWGGWYHSELLLSELRRLREIRENMTDKDFSSLPAAKAVLFIDEKAYGNVSRASHLRHSVNITRCAMGNTGIPFDTYMVEDAPRVLHRYSAAIFSAPVPSEDGIKAIRLCRSLDIPYAAADEHKDCYTTDELREFLFYSGIHCYNSDGCVIYCGNGILGIHTREEREVKISLPDKYKITPLFGEDRSACEADSISIKPEAYGTYAFEITPPCG